MNVKLRKILIGMCRMCLYAFIGCQTLAMAMASETSAQQKYLKDISFELSEDHSTRDVGLIELIEEIEGYTGLSFAYRKKDVAKTIISLSNEKLDLATLCSEISVQGRFSIHRVNETITLIPVKKTGGNLPSVNEQLNAVAQVSGVVTDESGEPLPGATVLEKGTSNGTTTDIDGNYTINVPDNAVLLVSFVGYITQEVAVNARSTIDISMELDVETLEEVVVVGYGTQRKSDVTGSFVRIKTEQTADAPNYSVLQSIQGLAPGITIESPETAGATPSLLVRGENSLSAGNGPLIVVDNIIYNGSIDDFNANDIETIDILKDASAAAVYGARAANGVLLITTKSGSAREPSINFNTYFGFSEPTDLIDVLDGAGYEQKIADYNAILLAADPNASPIVLTQEEIANRDAGQDLDWIDEALRSGAVRNYHLSASGGSEKTDYYVSANYFDQDGILKGDDFQRITVNLNLNTDVTDWLTLAARTSYTGRDFSGAAVDFSQAYIQSPYGDFFDEDGPGGYNFFPIGDQLGEHPLLPLLYENEEKSSSLRGIFSTIVTVPFVEGLRWTTNYSNNVRDQRTYNFRDNESSRGGILANGSASKRYRRRYDWTLDNIINYRRDFDKHSVDLTLLYSREYREFDETNASSTDFVSQELGFYDIDLGNVPTASSNFTDQNAIAQMARINYAYDSKYALTFTARRDGVSVFAANNKFATFLAAAFAWTASNEAFLQDVHWLNYLKLKLSVGENGNQAIGRYSSLSRISTGEYLFGNSGSTIPTYSINSLANVNLSWETTLARNARIEFSVLDDKLSGTIETYLSNTTDLLQSRSLPRTTGFGSVTTNIGEVENRGLEISLNSTNIDRSGFKWQTGFVFSRNRNKIVTLGGVDADGDGVEDDDISNGWFIGESINSIFGYQVDGIYQTGDDIPDGFRPGDFRVVDANGDGELGPEDRQILGTEDPNYIASMTNTFTYRNFSLYVMVTTTQGGGNNNFYVGDNFESISVNKRNFTTFTERFNFQDVPYWTPENPSNVHPRLDYAPVFNHDILEDRSFVRIQDINLAYRLPQNILDKLTLKSLKVYGSIKNLATFTEWSGYNPERATTINSNTPFLRTFTLGVDVGL